MNGNKDIVNGGGHIVATLTLKESAQDKPMFHQTCVVSKDGRTLRLKFIGSGHVGMLTFRNVWPEMKKTSPST
jgi:hypothetical protein